MIDDPRFKEIWDYRKGKTIPNHFNDFILQTLPAEIRIRAIYKLVGSRPYHMIYFIVTDFGTIVASELVNFPGIVPCGRCLFDQECQGLTEDSKPYKVSIEVFTNRIRKPIGTNESLVF